VAREFANRILARGTEGARLVMGAVIRCYEPWAVYSPDEVRRASGESYMKESQVAGAEYFQRICPIVPRPEPEALYGPAQISAVPALLLSGEEDPQDPPENVAGIEAVYPNSRALFEPYRGHYTVNWSCIAAVVTEFIELGAVDGLQAPCLSKVHPYPFDIRP
jgi:hypothetical protein